MVFVMYQFESMLMISMMVIALSLIVLIIIEIKKIKFEKLKYSMSDKWDEHVIDGFYNTINEKIDYTSEVLTENEITKINEDADLKIAVNAVLNFFEGVGYAYNRNIIDKHFAESSFSDPVITAYKRYFSIIEESRVKYNDPRMLCELEKMYKVMIRNRERLSKN